MGSIKKSIVSGAIWSFLERMSAQLVSVIVAIILARLLSPNEYGTISLVTIFISLGNVFVTDGFGSALIQKKDADDVDFSTVFYFGIAFSMLLYVALFFGANWIAKFYEKPILVPVIRVLSIKLIIASFNSVQLAYVSRNMLFKRFFYSNQIGTIISAVVGILMAYNGFGVWSLVAQDLTNSCIDTMALWITVKWRPIKKFSFGRLKMLFSYGWKLLVQSFANTLYGNIRSLVIGKVYTPEDLAYYNKGSDYPNNLIAANVDTAINKALFPAMAKEQQDFNRIKSIARRATKLCSYVMCPLLIGFASCADSFVMLLLTEKWMPIVPYIQIICVCLLIRPAQTTALQAIKATGKSDIVLKMDMPVRFFGIVALIIAVQYGVIYIAISEVVVEFFGLLLYGMACDKVIGYSLSEIFVDLGYNVIQALLMGICVWGCGKVTNFSHLFTILIQVFVGFFTYILVSVVFKNENFKYLLDVAIKVIKKRKNIN